MAESVPTRDDVRTMWVRLVDHQVDRQEAYDWARPWVESLASSNDPMAITGLQYLHGFYQSHDPHSPGVTRMGPWIEWVKDDAQISSDLERWEKRCEEYDRDPAGFMCRAKELAIREFKRQYPNRTLKSDLHDE